MASVLQALQALSRKEKTDAGETQTFNHKKHKEGGMGPPSLFLAPWRNFLFLLEALLFRS